MLRCFRCSGSFIVSHISIERVKMVAAIFPCPACGARPVVRADAESRLHRLIDFSDELETVYRKRKELEIWHFTPDCPLWPSDEFIELNARPKLGEMCRECLCRVEGRE
jgi:predicted RNA-binding Zn-ribbon protein involved in translation (DUF1610 family)